MEHMGYINHILTTDIVHEVGIKDQNGGIKHLSGNGIGRDHGKKKRIYILHV